MSETKSNASKIEEGRGKGSGASYKPWIQTREISSCGTCSNPKDWKTGRTVELLSQGEAYFWHILRWDDNILDIREQYPLDLELTNEICDDRCCKHPGGRNCYMTTDFYVIYKDGSEKAFSVKTSRNLLKKRRTKEKLDIERCYWEKFRHVPYEIVFKEDMNVVFAENIRIVSKFYNASSVFDEMSMLKHMIATKRIQVDMESEPLDFPYLLEQFNEQTTRQIIKMRGKIEDSAPTGFALLGYSGCGKSTSLKQLFDNIPQVIMHHPDPATNITQITYLVVSCMPNSNFATLYRQIGEAIDNALGYPEPVYELMITKKCRSLAEKQLKVCELIEKFSIGTIVLDEIQLINFNSNKENSYEGLLGIVNKTKIALSVVGTDEAYKKLFGMLRNARRAGEYINASAYTSDKEYFNFLLSMLLTWQWLDKPITKAQAQKLSDTLYECTGGIINMLIWLYKWIMIEYLDNRSKGTIVIINEKFIKSVSKKHFGQLKGAIDMVNQAKVEEMEDEQILMLAESDKNKYEMPETNVENLAYESKMINIVIGKVHQIYTDVTSDDIARYVRQILAEDEYHRMKPTEVAKEVVAIITGNPTRKKRRPSSKAPASKNICDYISNT